MHYFRKSEGLGSAILYINILENIKSSCLCEYLTVKAIKNMHLFETECVELFLKNVSFLDMDSCVVVQEWSVSHVCMSA